MSVRVFDIYKVGAGRFSSHTFGPIVEAERFLTELNAGQRFARTAKAEADLQSRPHLPTAVATSLPPQRRATWSAPQGT